MGLFTNKADIEILAGHVQAAQELLTSPSLEQFALAPPEPENTETIKTKLREIMASTAHHACGTAAMLPFNDGGVVDQDLKVYGTSNLRIVDASVIPLVPHAKIMATVYAVA